MGPRARRPPWQGFLLNAGLALSLLVVTAEVTLWLGCRVSPAIRRFLFLPGEPRAWTNAGSLQELLEMAPFRPPPATRYGAFVLNRHGFATPEYATAKTPGSMRIVALGDSFTFDSSFVPQDAMWHRLLGVRLATARGRPVEVVNLGVPATGPRFALRMFEVEGRRLAPDLVLFGLFVGNDLTDEAGGRGSWLRRWSLLWRLGGNLRLIARTDARLHSTPVDPANAGRPVAGYRYDPAVAFTPEDEYVRVARERAALFRAAAWPEVEPLVDATVGTVRALAEGVAASGALLLVAVMPDRAQVDPATEVIARDGFPAGTTFDFIRVSETVTTRLADAGICAVDLLAAFRAAPAPDALWRSRDTHWSVAGNALAADAIWPVLERCLATSSPRHAA